MGVGDYLCPLYVDGRATKVINTEVFTSPNQVASEGDPSSILTIGTLSPEPSGVATSEQSEVSFGVVCGDTVDLFFQATEDSTIPIFYAEIILYVNEVQFGSTIALDESNTEAVISAELEDLPCGSVITVGVFFYRNTSDNDPDSSDGTLTLTMQVTSIT